MLVTILSVAGDIAGGISKNRFQAITFDWSDPVQCLAGYYHMICGHILDENYKWGVLVNTCKEFGLYHPQKGDHLRRASLPPSEGIHPFSGW